MFYRKTNELTKSRQQLQNHVIHQCETPIQVIDCQIPLHNEVLLGPMGPMVPIENARRSTCLRSLTR